MEGRRGLLSIGSKLRSGRRLDGEEVRLLVELSDACGWALWDVMEEIKQYASRAERYGEAFECYLRWAEACFSMKRYEEAGALMYGAAVALLKRYAAEKWSDFPAWSEEGVEKFITDVADREAREALREMVDRARRLYRGRQEGEVDDESFRERWEEVAKSINRARWIVEALARGRD